MNGFTFSKLHNTLGWIYRRCRCYYCCCYAAHDLVLACQRMLVPMWILRGILVCTQIQLERNQSETPPTLSLQLIRIKVGCQSHNYESWPSRFCKGCLGWWNVAKFPLGGVNERRPTQQCPPRLSGETEKIFFKSHHTKYLNCRPVDDEIRGQQVGEEGGALLNIWNSARAFPTHGSWLEWRDF